MVGQADDGERLLRGVARVSFNVDAPEPREETEMVSACVEINQCVGCTDNSSLSHLTAMARLSWLGRAARKRHRHAIILISTQVVNRVEIKFTARLSPSTPSTRRLLDGVAMPVPRRSTEPGQPRHRREVT